MPINISELKQHPNNPRDITKDELERLTSSIEGFQKMMKAKPIVVDENNQILAGNQRHKALIELGYKELPDEWVKKITDFSESEKKEFMIRDNVSNGHWTWDSFNDQFWEEEPFEEWIGEEASKKIIEKTEAKEDDYEIPEEIKTDIVHGDIFLLAGNGLKHKVLCGDSTITDDWGKLFEDNLADLVLTDPPYNVDYVGKTKDALKIENDKMDDDSFYQFLYDFYTALYSYTKKGGSWYVWHASSEVVSFAKAFKDAGLLLKQQLIWVKNSMVMGRQDYHWKHEPCLYGWKEGASHSWYADRKQTTVLEFDRPNRNSEHPTMKPIPLMAYQINNSSKKGDIVADGFLGSGSTMVAAHQLERNCYGIELDPNYVQVCIERMVNLDPEIKVLKNGVDVTNKYVNTAN